MPQQLIYMVQSSPDNGSSLKSAMRLPGLFAWNLHRLSTRSKCISNRIKRKTKRSRFHLSHTKENGNKDLMDFKKCKTLMKKSQSCSRV